MNYQDQLHEEEQNMDLIYSIFEDQLDYAEQNKKAADDSFYNEQYDDKEKFIMAGIKAKAAQKEYAARSFVDSMYKKPYFAHVSLDGPGIKNLELFLSDNENLHTVETVAANPNIKLIPFKQDKNRPVLTAAFSCYQKRNGKPVSIFNSTRKQNDRYLPKLVRDVDVNNKQINNVMTLFPYSELNEDIKDVDELLAKKLDENRGNARLRNIIATLQMQQFDIIQTDINTEFVVQGCAGSGKSQCLLHRLFFFRDVLQEEGWDKVLLITPSALFRAYSSELLHRFNLHTVTNTSIAELYKQLLGKFDKRFESRQYEFELTEEYLPDSYLSAVYNPENINKMYAEIKKTIRSYVEEGYSLLDVSLPVNSSDIDIEYVNVLLEKLRVLEEQCKEREVELKNNSEFQLKVSEYEKTEKQLEQLQKRLIESKTSLSQDYKDRSEFLNLYTQYNSIKAEENSRVNGIAVSNFDSGANSENKKLEKINRKLHEITGDLLPEKWLEKKSKKIRTLEENIEKISADIPMFSEQQAEIIAWFEAGNFSEHDYNFESYIEEIDRVKRKLNRIESDVFEHVVWKTLAPLKGNIRIQTTRKIIMSNNQERNVRILYKSDLLFYLMIYERLYRVKPIPKYKYICIDEGQDLNAADYSMLRKLFPDAVFNVFGDLDQVIRPSSGISEWQSETRIQKVFYLNNNYRNSAGIADFCNREFGSKMKFLGSSNQKNYPRLINNYEELASILSRNKDIVIILKNKNHFKDFLKKMPNEKIKNRLVFVDTETTQTDENMIPCYSVYAAKGLEFSRAFVYMHTMTRNQKIVACTRAMQELYYSYNKL